MCCRIAGMAVTLPPFSRAGEDRYLVEDELVEYELVQDEKSGKQRANDVARLYAVEDLPEEGEERQQ